MTSTFADGASSYTTVATKFNLRGFLWHPFQPWALAYEPNIECEREHLFKHCFGNLVVSVDSGAHWDRVLNHVK